MPTLTTDPTNKVIPMSLPTLARRLCALLALVVPFTMLQLVLAQGPASAAELCALNPTGLECGPTYAPPGLLSPAALAAATPAQAASLRVLEDQAIENIMVTHGLPAQDREAVASRGRYNAQMELYSLIAEAARTSAGERTADQQNAVDWMVGLLRGQLIEDGNQVGAEYVAFAGLNPDVYSQLIESNATQDELRAFLTTKQPVNYNNVDKTKATGGYCVYRAPAPYEEDYKGYNSVDCDIPCPYQLGCQVPTPKYDDFVDWGVARAAARRPLTEEQHLLLGLMGEEAATTTATVASGTDFQASAAQASGVTAGVASIVGPLVAEVVRERSASMVRAAAAVQAAREAQAALDPAKVAARTAKNLLAANANAFAAAESDFVTAASDLAAAQKAAASKTPEALKALEEAQKGYDIAEKVFDGAKDSLDEAMRISSGATKAAKTAEASAKAAGTTAAEAGAGVLDSVLAAGKVVGRVLLAVLAVADVFLTIVDAIVTIVLASIELADAADLPGKLAELIVGNRSLDVDANAYFEGHSQVMLALFAAATGPAVRSGRCDNSLIPLTAYDDGYAQNVTMPVAGGGVQEITVEGHPCLNAPDVPGVRDTDPQFLVTSPDGRQRITPTITTLMGESAESALPLQTRLSGNWFITGVDGVPDLTWQNLQLYYLNSAGEETLATLRHDPDEGWRFFGSANFDETSQLDSSTCRADRTCWDSESIDYLAPDGTVRTARVVPPPVPQGFPAVLTGATDEQPVEGSPVAFSSNGFAPPVSEGHDLFYEWKFQKDDCGMPCMTTLASGGISGGAATGPSYGDGTDDYGQEGSKVQHTWQASGTYSVKLLVIDTVTKQHVEQEFTVEVADVAPDLDLHYSPGPYAPGQAVGVGGVITHAGANDTERVDIYWGDGTRSVDIDGPAQILVVGSPITFSTMSDGRIHFASGHSYAEPGTYQALATVVDNGGGAATYPFTITVAAPA